MMIATKPSVIFAEDTVGKAMPPHMVHEEPGDGTVVLEVPKSTRMSQPKKDK